MDIKELLAHFEGLARVNEGGSYIPSRARANDLREWLTDFCELLEHEQREADTAKAGIDLRRVGVFHALSIGLEETHKAHAVIEAHRREAVERTNEAMRKQVDEKRSKVAAAILSTVIRQIETTPSGKQLTALAFGFEDRERAIMILAESIANNLAVYVTIPGQCEVCGEINAGNTCCPPERDLSEERQAFVDQVNDQGTYDDADSTSEEG